MSYSKIIALLLSLTSTGLWAELKVAKSLSDNMVFQRDRPIVLWGQAKPNSDVRVSFGEEKQSTQSSAEGTWEISLAKRSSNSKAQSILIQSETDSLELKNILIGEVWFCAGQSNMAMKLPNTLDYQKAKDYLQNHQIRFLAMNKRPYTKPFQKDLPQGYEPTQESISNFYEMSGWRSCQDESISKLSAVAYWFANSLHRELNVPIGLIVPPLGGSATQAWVSRELFEKSADIKPLLKQWIQDEPEGLQKQFKAWVEAHPNYKFDQTPLHRHRPTTLFEAGVKPVQNHHVRGVIWYQGEQNAQNEVQRSWFEKCFPKLIEGFRIHWNQPRLPFYHVQLPGFGNEEWPAFRDLQRQFLSIPHTGMAITIDLGLEKNIHPKDKSPIGKRLARLALNREYQKYHIQTDGPQIVTLKQKGTTVWIDFDEGLNLKDGKVDHFELAGEDGVFYEAKAQGSIQSVTLKCDSVTEPRYVRYAWKGFPRPIQLKNSEGLSTGPFTLALPKL